MNRRQALPPIPRGESGSAYLIALLSLVVLTILGLALVLVTQTEVQVGANERTINRTFYAADAGVNVPFAEFMTNSDPNTPRFTLNEISRGTASTIGDVVTPTPTAPLLVQCCNYCECDDKDDNKKQVEVVLASTATAQRLGTDNSGATIPQSEKVVSVIIDTWPIQKSKLDLLKTIQDPTALQNIKW